MSSQRTILIQGIEVEVDFDYSPGRPGNTSGRPEDCYPEEYPELEINKVLHDREDIFTLLSEEAIKEAETTIEQLLDKEAEEAKYGDL